jgi:hypothetical protein
LRFHQNLSRKEVFHYFYPEYCPYSRQNFSPVNKILNCSTMSGFQADGTFGSGVGVGLLPLHNQTPGFGKPTIAIMSFGEMGMGIATLLFKYSYPVITNLDGRSANTKARAHAIGVGDLPIEKMLDEATIVLSIVPPAEAYSLAKLTATVAHTPN